jgi:pyruvate formate lyase activating enzyme
MTVKWCAFARVTGRLWTFHLIGYVYLGNAPEVKDAETTFCPKCRKAVIERRGFDITTMNAAGGKCDSCGTAIAGVWATA